MPQKNLLFVLLSQTVGKPFSFSPPVSRSIVTFYGAYYREGSVTIALELMDGGSLTNVLQQVGIIPEPILAGIMYQIIWATAYLMAEDKMHRVRRQFACFKSGILFMLPCL